MTDSAHSQMLSQVVERLPREREKLLVSYCNMLGLDLDEMATLKLLLAEFGQQLTDYSALSQLGLVEAVAAENDDLADHAERLRAMTEQYLQFVERYQPGSSGHDIEELCRDIETVGVSLADRFEIEDELVRRLNGGAS